LFLLRISFITDFNSQTINLQTYLSEQNPVVVPIGSDLGATTTTMQGILATKYGTQISVQSDSSDNAAAAFDQNYLFPLKISQSTLKAGIFFYTSTTPGLSTNVLYPFNTLV
jgi:hypothetical protein